MLKGIAAVLFCSIRIMRVKVTIEKWVNFPGDEFLESWKGWSPVRSYIIDWNDRSHMKKFAENANHYLTMPDAVRRRVTTENL